MFTIVMLLVSDFILGLCSSCELHDQANNSECVFTDRSMPPIWLRTGLKLFLVIRMEHTFVNGRACSM